ncbi:MAG: hypothetical protein R2764_01460 [Bacteroidales bacterium]
MAKQANNDKQIVIQQVILSQIQRNNVDIGKWRSALINAEGIYNPNRAQLYDLYHDIILDSHLSSVMQKEKHRYSIQPFCLCAMAKWTKGYRCR